MQSEGTFFGLAVSFEYTFNFKFWGALFREVHKQNATVLLGRVLLAEMLHSFRPQILSIALLKYSNGIFWYLVTTCSNSVLTCIHMYPYSGKFW